ncbi:MAG TPA: hypothetical protein VHE53_00630 [Patescibacteria group bacterium]|nr:hypothetical protein [Patescibacteria group bacterium]
MREKLNDVEFFERTNLRPLNEQEERQAVDDYITALKDGLDTHGEKGLPMYPSLLSSVSLSDLREGSQALIVEIGGTNLYGARVAIENSKPSIQDSQRAALPGREFRSADEFFAHIANGVAPMLDQGNIDAIGIVYSFPGQAVKTDGGVDIVSPEQLTKEFVIPGISKLPVGQALRESLSQNYGIDANTPTSVMNDTVAVVFSDGAKLGGVVGTGFNLAADTPNGVINTESGSFSGFPLNELAKIVDRQSGRSGMTGKYLAEKQISGLWLGQQMEIVAQELSREGIPHIPSNLDSETITNLLITTQGNPMLIEAAERLRNRSAQLVGVMIAGITKAFPETFTEEQLQIPVEGSLFWKVPGYKEIAQEVAKRLTQKSIHFVNIEEAGRIGAAVAALGNANKR